MKIIRCILFVVLVVAVILAVINNYHIHKNYQSEIETHLKTIEELRGQAKELEQMLIFRVNFCENIKSNLNIHTPSGFTAEDIEKAYIALGAKDMIGTGEHFVQAEKDVGINAVFLVALAYHESGAGTSVLAKEKNNYFGWGAYDYSPYKCAYSFSSREEGIKHVAKEISRIYQNHTIEEVGVRYASDPKWAGRIASTMRLIVETIMLKEKHDG